jgi:methionyl-tRNA formyltransferase
MRPDVLLIGMGTTTLSALQSLLETCRVVGVVRESPDPLTDPVVALARGAGVPVFPDASLTGVEAAVRDGQPDCVVVSSFGRVLPAAILARCPFINVHYAPLPAYRGQANVNWALLNGEPTAAISIHVLELELDAGNVLFQEMVNIRPTDTVADLYARLNDMQRQHLGATVLRFLSGDHGIPQVGEPTYGCMRTPDDGEIDWRQSTVAIDRLVRALVRPFPGAFTHAGGERLIVWKAEPVTAGRQYVGRIPGRVVSVSRRYGHVDVLTGDGTLRLLDVQRGDETPAPAAAVITSVRTRLGIHASDLLERIAALEAEVRRMHARLREGGEPATVGSERVPVAHAASQWTSKTL